MSPFANPLKSDPSTFQSLVQYFTDWVTLKCSEWWGSQINQIITLHYTDLAERALRVYALVCSLNCNDKAHLIIKCKILTNVNKTTIQFHPVSESWNLCLIQVSWSPTSIYKYLYIKISQFSILCALNIVPNIKFFIQ